MQTHRDQLQALALMDSIAGDGGDFWGFYSDSLLPSPEALTVPMCWEEQLLSELRHPEVEEAAKAQQVRRLAVGGSWRVGRGDGVVFDVQACWRAVTAVLAVMRPPLALVLSLIKTHICKRNTHDKKSGPPPVALPGPLPPAGPGRPQLAAVGVCLRPQPGLPGGGRGVGVDTFC
jgi:hypothetical protein